MDAIKKHKTIIIQAILFSLFPLVCAGVYCLKDGRVPGDVFLPASYWNDELMYFKQVESVVKYGLPQGWFGFQETHGSVYPFAAWSPVILLPWVVWGKVFGWSLTTPVYANIVFNMIALGGFALLVKPDAKRSAFVLGLLAVFVPYTRYMLSGMPEALCMSLGVWLVALSISYIRVEKLWKLLAQAGIVMFLTLARPYLGLFFLLPLWFAFRRYRGRGVLAGAAVTGISAAGYMWVATLCCSPYIEPIIETEWLGIFGTEGFGAGIKFIFGTLYDKFAYLFSYYLKLAVKQGLFSGALYAMTGMLALLLLLRWIWALRQKKEEKLRPLCLFQFIATAGMILALFLFYRMGEGSKHLLIFIVFGLLLTAMLEERVPLLKFVAGVLCLYFFVYKALAPYDWQVAYDDGNMRRETESLQSQMKESMILDDSGQRYDNTVIWLASDLVDGESRAASWGLLYAVPAGYGINFCTQQYVTEHLGELQSGYIAVLPGGEVDARLQKAGALPVAETEHMRVYCLHE